MCNICARYKVSMIKLVARTTNDNIDARLQFHRHLCQMSQKGYISTMCSANFMHKFLFCNFWKYGLLSTIHYYVAWDVWPREILQKIVNWQVLLTHRYECSYALLGVRYA